MRSELGVVVEDIRSQMAFVVEAVAEQSRFARKAELDEVKDWVTGVEGAVRWNSAEVAKLRRGGRVASGPCTEVAVHALGRSVA